jgi:DNA polymerase-3 subunit alpha
MRQLIIKLKPSCFEDMIALVALFRPGPLGSGMVDDFIERKHGRQQINYPVPQLEPILKETYGVILYQEQVMKTAGELASYSLGEADLLRRAMGKKIAEEMAKQKTRFMEGAVKNGHPEEKAGEIFDLMAEFANYGFNKSHSAAYGLVSYQTGYLKSHYTDEFMAAIMTCDLDNTKKIVRYVDECRRLRITVLPPDINRSILSFDVPKPGTIGFGLAALKGVGAGSIEGLVKEREARGPFKDLSDLARRINLHTIGKKTLELLTQAGAMDGFGMSRPKLFSVLGDVVKYSESLHAAKAGGQRGLFDLDDEAEAPAGGRADGLSWPLTAADKRPGAPDPAWLKKEKALLGVFLTGHPLQFHREDVRCFGRGVKAAELEKHLGKKSVAMVAVLAFANERLTKSGKRMGSLRLEDESGAVEAIMFEKEMPKEFPEQGALVVAVGSVDKAFDGDGIRYRLDKVTLLEELRQEHVERVTLRVRPVGGLAAKKADYAFPIEQLQALVKKHAGDTPLRIVVDYETTEVELGGELAIDLVDAFLHGLGHLAFERLELGYELFKTSASVRDEGFGLPPPASAGDGYAAPDEVGADELAMGRAMGFGLDDEIPLPAGPG